MKTIRYCLLPLLLLAFSVLPALAQVADFTTLPSSGCVPFAVALHSTSTGTIIAYDWTISDGRVLSGSSPSTSFTAAGTYTITLTVTGSSGSKNSVSKVINAYPSPTVSFTASPVRICPCEEVTFTNTSVANAPGPYTSLWSFGDGNTATTNNTTYRYCTPGTYNVALKVINSAGCYASKIETAKVTVVEKPIAEITTSKTSLCKIPDTIWFTGSSMKGRSPFTYSWDFGDGGSGTGSNPYHLYTAAGKYTIRLVITDANGCKDTLTKLNYITATQMESSFSTPAPTCQGVSLVRFTNTSVPDSKLTKWIWSDGEVSGSLHSQRYFWKAGTFTVTMIDSFGPGCKDTFTSTYTVHPKPKPNFMYWPVYPCPAPVDVHFKNRTSGADSFLWIFGDGTTSLLKDPVHTYTRDSIYTVFMIGKSKYGCLDTFRVRDTSKAFPGGYPSPLYDSTNSPIIIRVYQNDMVIKRDVYHGCIPLKIAFGAELKSITRLPSVNDTTRPLPLCMGLAGYNCPPYWLCSHLPAPDPYPDEFYDPPVDYTYPYPYPARSYFWDFGDGTTSTDASPVHIYTIEGERTVKCTIKTDSCSFTDSIVVEAGFKPTANFSFYPDTICKGDFAYVTNLSSNGLKYTWDWADGFTDVDTSKTLFHKYRVWGSRRISLTAERFGCIDTISKLLTINPPGSYFGMKYSCDTPLKVSFLDSSIRATKTYWIFGDGDTSTQRNPVHTYAAAGTYKVRQATANDSFPCVDTSERTIRVFYPNPGFTAKNTCLRDSTIIVDVIPDYIESFSWSTADPVAYDSDRNRFYVVYRDTGTYSLSLFYRDIHKCVDSLRKKDYIIVAKPYVKFLASPLKACAPATVNFTDNSTNAKGVSNISRTWLWGDATTTVSATATTASHFYPDPGTYKIQLIVTDNIGCKDSAYISVESRKPKADFVAETNDTTCMFRNIKFHSISTGGSLSYQWYFGDGNTAIGSDPVNAYTKIGTFNVKLVVTDDIGCKDSITKSAFITTTKPAASFKMSDTLALCPPLFVAFTNTSSSKAIRYLWDFDNGTTSAIQNPTAPFLDPKIYSIKLIAYDKFGCTDTAYGKGRVAGYSGGLNYTPLFGCVPLTVAFEAELISVDVMIWDFADGNIEGAEGKPNTSHTYTMPGAYIPRLILGDGKGCSTSSLGIDTIKVDDVEAKINTSPKCVGEEITFEDASRSYFSNYSSSEWTFDDGTKSTDKNPTHKYTKPGTYAVSLVTENSNGCKDTLHTSITINPLPLIKANNTVICLGDSAILSASGGVSYKWAASPTLSCTDCNTPTSITTVPVMYFVTGTDNNGCKNYDTLSVGIKTKTTLILADNAEICEGIPIQLQASGAHGYSWSPDSFLNNANIPNPVATMKHSIVYRVIGTEGSCIPDTAFIDVTVHPTPEVNAGPDQKVLAGTEVQLGESGKYIKDYLWTPDTLLSCGNCPNPLARPIETTTFTLKGTSEFGCIDTDDVIITIFCDQSQLFIPNTFTPNGDGQNDYFFPQGKGISKISSFVIFNRWGQKVFERTGINANIKEQGWDGSFNGNKLGPDTYVYTLEAVCDNGETVFWKGDVTIIW